MNSADLQSLKSQIDLLEFFRARGLSPKKEGSGYKVACPFHEDRTPSMSVDPGKGLWNCFSCGQGGDVLTYLQLSEGKSFPEAVRELQALAGQPTVDRDLNLLARVAELYHANLEGAGLDYLASRGLSDLEMMRAFQVGFSNGKLPFAKHEIPALQTLGILNDKAKEVLTGCVVIPLRDQNNRIVSLYGRRIHDNGHRLLSGPRCGWVYPVQGATELIVVEGVLDALACYQAGVRNVVALNGTNGLFPSLKSWLETHPRLVLCLDSDPAGDKAAEELAASLKTECVRMKLPVKDPAEFFRSRSVEEFRALIPRKLALAPQQPEKSTTVDGQEVFLRSDDFTFKARLLTERGGKFRALVVLEDANQKTLSDTFDLRSRKSRVSFARTAGGRWPGLSRVEETLEELLGLLESAVFDEEEGPREIVLTQAERAEALAYLARTAGGTKPGLIDSILADLDELGYVGEEENKLLVYLISVSRMTPKPLSGIILSGSGAGKSFLTELVERLTPPEGVEFYSRLSQHALAFMDPFQLQGKAVIMEERAGGEAADYSIRSLQTRHEFVNAIPLKDPKTGKIKTVHNTVYGPIAYLETTTNPNLNPENTSRCFMIQLDESREQTARIQESQRRARSFIKDPAITERLERLHHNLQRVLEKKPVIIPYSDHLTFSDRYLRNRRDNERFLSLLSVVAFLHQLQRPKRVICGKEYIEATIEDYEIVYQMAPKILLAAVDELSRWGRELLTFFQEDALTEHPVPGWSRKSLRERLSWPDKRTRAALDELVAQEHLTVFRGPVGNVFFYKLNLEGGLPANVLTLGLLTPFELRRILSAGKRPNLRLVDDEQSA